MPRHSEVALCVSVLFVTCFCPLSFPLYRLFFCLANRVWGAAGHTAEVKELLNKHGADKLSEIDPSEYPALLADAEVL